MGGAVAPGNPAPDCAGEVLHDRFDSSVYRPRGRRDNLNHGQNGLTREAWRPSHRLLRRPRPRRRGTGASARQGYVNRFEHLASAPTVMAAWVRVRCGHSIEITGMFNAHHA